jgi:hypothetical protein
MEERSGSVGGLQLVPPLPSPARRPAPSTALLRDCKPARWTQPRGAPSCPLAPLHLILSRKRRPSRWLSRGTRAAGSVQRTPPIHTSSPPPPLPLLPILASSPALCPLLERSHSIWRMVVRRRLRLWWWRSIGGERAAAVRERPAAASARLFRAAAGAAGLGEQRRRLWGGEGGG